MSYPLTGSGAWAALDGLWEELDDSPQGSISRGGNSVTRSFKVTGNETILGEFVKLMATGDGTHPAASVVLSNVLLSGITFRPWESAVKSGTISTPIAGAGVANHWRVDCQYELYHFNKAWPTDITKPTHDSGTVLQLRTRTSGQFLTLTPRAVEYSDGSGRTTPDMDARIAVLIREMMVDWINVYNPPFATIDACIGKVNAVSFMGCPAETLLFEGLDTDDDFWIGTADPFRYRLSYIFRRRIIPGTIYGWNHDYREFPAGWAKVKLKDGSLRYPTGNFNPLFTQ